MASEFRLPALGADMETGTVLEWNVAPGSRVRRGDVVAVVETDKGAIDVEIFEDGVVREIVVPPGQQVPVGTVLALIDAEGTEAAAPEGARVAATAEAGAGGATKAKQPQERVTAAEAEEKEEKKEEEELEKLEEPQERQEQPERQKLQELHGEPEETPRLRISPAARRRAGELGIDVELLEATGPDGAVTLADVERAAAAAPAAAPPAGEELSAAPIVTGAPVAEAAEPAAAAAAGPVAAQTGGGMREAIASAMSRAKREIPHYYLSSTADVTDAIAWLERHNASAGVEERLLFVALLVKAVALACRDFEGFSGYYRDGRYDESPVVHVGVAVALRGGGLVAPAIMGTADKPLGELMSDFRALVMRARAGRLRASELAAPTIILTSLGDSVVETVFPIIQPPQVAIVGAGAVSTRAGVVDGKVVPRQVLSLSLAADHRVTDGRLGARFLSRIVERLADPQSL